MTEEIREEVGGPDCGNVPKTIRDQYELVIRVRRLLKAMIRGYGLRVVSIRELGGELSSNDNSAVEPTEA